MKAIARNLPFGLFLAFLPCAAQSTVGWPVYNGGPGADHYSQLTQIDRANVNKLTVAWTYNTGEKGDIQDNPLIVGGTLYAYTPTQKVIALDAATGELKWKFDSGIRGTQPVRGVAYWTGGKDERIFAGVMNFLYCLDARTGKPVPSFGENGRIDLRKNLRGDYEHQSIVLTTPGIIYKDLIIVGGRNPESHPAPPGDIRAYDVRTGALRWTFQTIAHPGEPGYDTWPPDAWKTAGAANNWAGMALDAQHGIVYVPTGSAVMDFYGGDRVGNDLYADTLLALDAGTGKLLWHFQGVHHDLWDRDFPAQPALYTVQRDGKTIEALAQITKQAYIYLFNRLTGQPLFPIHELPYPASTVPGEVTSPTQPKPDAPAPFGCQQLTEAMLTNRTPQAHAWAVSQFRTFQNGGQFVPFAVGKQTVVFPGFDGGGEWGGAAIDPVNDVLYVGSTEMAWTGGLVPAAQQGSAGQKIYQSDCALCHGVNRAGNPPTFPSLIGVLGRLSPEQVRDNIIHGKGRMPGFPSLDASQLAALLAYLRAGPAPSARPAEHEKRDPAPVATDSEAKAGAAVFAQNCSICHGANRAGHPPIFPSLIGELTRQTPAQIHDRIIHGKGRMPPLPNLTEAQISEVIAFLRTSPAPSAGHSKTEEMPAAQPEDKAGAAVYADHCAICHGDHREGIPPSFPALLGVGSRLTAGQIVNQIHHGKGRMPAMPDIQGPELKSLLRFLGAGGSASADPPATAAPQNKYVFTGYRKFLDPDGYPAIAPPWGTLNAIDLKTGKYLWKIPLGEYPALVKQGIRNTGSELYGGPIVTGGGLVFIGATVYDRKFHAFDSTSGKLLWQTELPYAGIATPSTYMVDGRQYVVIAASGGRDPKGPVGGEYIAFALPR